MELKKLILAINHISEEILLLVWEVLVWENSKARRNICFAFANVVLVNTTSTRTSVKLELEVLQRAQQDWVPRQVPMTRLLPPKLELRLAQLLVIKAM